MVQCLGLRASTAENMCSIPSWETKILQPVQCGNNNNNNNNKKKIYIYIYEGRAGRMIPVFYAMNFNMSQFHFHLLSLK